MTNRSLDRHIEITPGIAGGRPRVAGHRITVQDIAIWHEHMGMQVDAICAEYGLSLAEVHAALAYYFDHKDEIDHRLAEDNALVEEFRRKTSSPLAEKLKEVSGG